MLPCTAVQSLSPYKDLLLVASSDGGLDAYRFFSWERLFHAQLEEQLGPDCRFTWASHGRHDADRRRHFPNEISEPFPAFLQRMSFW